MTNTTEPDTKRRQLEHILSDESFMDTEEDDTLMAENAQDDPQENDQSIEPPPEGFCIECSDQAAVFLCLQCEEDFCEVCFNMLHRTGSRQKHTRRSLKEDPTTVSSSTTLSSPSSRSLSEAAGGNSNHSSSSSDSLSPASLQSKGDSQEEVETSKDSAGEITPPTVNLSPDRVIKSSGMSFGDWITERTKHIPLRLTLQERKYLRLVEAALSVSEYTDKVDIIIHSNKATRIVNQIKELCTILSGLVVSWDYKRGQELFRERNFEDNEVFYQTVFEIARRHKVMNPEKMRSAYGKLMYMLMDSMIPEVQEILGVNLVIPIKTVHNFLSGFPNGLALLQDDLVATATKEIIPDCKSRYVIQEEIKRKERAVEILARKYSGNGLTAEEVRQALYSIGDNHAYLRQNRDPCDRMLRYLTHHFSPSKPSPSLAIISGRSGHRLTHSHPTQYWFVHQSLCLWREVLDDMFRLWWLSDADMLSSRNSYRLRDTGQGRNRVQGCPGVRRAMSEILNKVQRAQGENWVGSSVIHLGDNNVPNALMFIDKYNQVSLILNPIILTLDKLDGLYQNNHGLRKYIDDMYGGVEPCKIEILADFFRSAFDGSGADNFFDAGSCIDGRLTSAWNWCSQIEKKRFFHIFLLTGFVGFNGDGW